MRLVVKIKAPQHGLFNTRILLALFVASQLASATTLQLNAASATQPSLSSKSTVDDKKNLKSDDLHASSSDVRLSSLASANQKLHDQVASPTMASVHQVWTSTSSGSLEELSPELIGKLRNDVPFLAAYALRPRLVGSTATLGSETRIPGSTSAALRTGEPLSTQLQAPSSAAELAASSSANSGLQIQATQQGKQVSLLPRLGDFSEFNVETSSTSKSEHSHRRRTTLKRKKPAKSAANLPQMKARKVTGAGQLKRKGRKPTKASPLKRRSKVKASRAAKLKKRLNIIRSGRYYQEQSISPSRGAINQVDVEERAVGDQTTMLAGETKGAAPTDEGVKGGNASGAKKPFYSKRIPSGKPGSSEVEAGERNGAKNDTSPTLDGAVTEDAGKENSVDDELGEEIDDLPDSAPRRVGDDDVEEGGDTVMVEPKSDGVDDDPDPAEYEPAVPEENELEGRQRESETEENQRENEKEEDERELNNEPEPRARRVHRERQNTSPASEQPDSPPRSQDDEKGTAAGGGIGATTGGAGSSDGAGSSGGKKRAEDEADEDEDDSRVFDDKRRKSTGKESENKSADEEDNKGDEQEDAGQREAPENTSGGKGSRRPDEDEPEEETSGGKRVGSTTSSQNSDDERRADSEEERLISERRRPAEEGRAEDEAAGDVDYRDELEAGARKKPDEESSSTANKDGATRHKTTANECAHHGSYSHDDEHHHHHHDTIRWLEEAVPGEPGKDYPILNRINSSLFKCAEQKYPGYYADVEARCQVFHICQADGRQDSFLCPNGTIFSQVSTVCVWWNSFECEDAPKYYDLNGLAYKEATAKKSPFGGASELKPLDGSRALRPKAAAGGSLGVGKEDEESSIDSLIKAMRSGAGSPKDSGAGVTYEDQGSSIGRKKSFATMMDSVALDELEENAQRKSNIADEDLEVDPNSSRTSARLRSKVEPRRKRRASARQAPPKLKSRRVSRNSRRRKLRHGIKPKRRA